MTRIKVHYDGWIALPAAVRRKFRLATGDELDLVSTGDGIMLRTRKPARPEAADEPDANDAVVAAAPAQEPAAEAPRATAPADAAPVEKPATKRGKRAAAATLTSLPTTVQARGRRGAKKATAG
jgi:AbrB family looped-hinge helix DNA binding protein